MIRHWEIFNRKTLHKFKFMQIEEKEVRSPRTGKSMHAMTIHFPAWVVVLALTAEQEVVMVNQYRHGTEEVHLELPGGLVDPDDPSPLQAAQRELLEETGYGSRDFRMMGECFPQPAILSNKCHFYLAKDAEFQQAQALDEGEDLQVVKIPMDDIFLKIQSNSIDNGMSLLAFYHFWMQKKKAEET
jgi:8-oxo-dGTP pyrophosphatase MutT (NUDIX family)